MTDETTTKLKRNRSSANPKFNLQQTVGFLEALYKALGKGPYSRQAISEALGHGKLNGTSIRKAASLAHYGLLTRKGTAYSPSNLSDRILMPTSPEDKAKAIMEAVQQPTLYAKLIDKYKGQSLPDLLKNILAREYGINAKSSVEVADTFIESVEFAGILKSGVITATVPETTKIGNYDEEGEAEEVDDQEDDESDNPPITKKSIKGKTPLELPCGITVYYPDTLAYNFALGEFSNAIKLLNDLGVKALETETTDGDQNISD